MLTVAHNIEIDFPNLNVTSKQQILELAGSNEMFAVNLWEGLGFCFHKLTPEMQALVWKKAEENNEFATALSMGLGEKFKDLDTFFQQ